jgi:hypothetical protein
MMALFVKEWMSWIGISQLRIWPVSKNVAA